MNIGTWNVRGLNLKSVEVFEKLSRWDVEIAVLSETKKKGQGIEEVKDYIHIFSGVNKEVRAKRGVSIAISRKYKNSIKSWTCVNENILTLDFKIKGIEMVFIGIYAPNDDAPETEKIAFFNQLTSVLDGIANRKDVFLLGDFNGRVGRQVQNDVVGRYGEETVNDNGKRLIEVCMQYGLKIWNGFFKHKDIHKFTWIRGTRRTIIDYVLGKHNNKAKVEDIRVYRGAECNSDHYLLRSKLYLPFVNKTQPTDVQDTPFSIQIPKYKLHLLTDPSINFLYKFRLSGKLSNIDYTSTQSLYDGIVRAIHEAAYESLGEAGSDKGKISDIWWNSSVEKRIREKENAYRKWLSTQDDDDKKMYSQISRETKKEIIKAKNAAWEKKCEEIDQCIGSTKARESWKLIKNLRTNETQCSALQLISLQQWKQYYQELMKEDRKEFINGYSINMGDIENVVEDITVNEIGKALRTFKNGKSPGPGAVCMELIKHGPSVLLEILCQLYNRCMKGETLPEDFRKGYISNIYKKGDRKQCGNYRGITVLCSIGRLYGKILKFRLEMELIDVEEQSGFRAGRSCTDNIFSIRQVTDKRLAHNLETHLVFIDLRKAYDTVPLNKLWMAMQKQDVKMYLLKAVKDLYSSNVSQIKIGRNLSEPFSVNKGLRQGCCIAPTLFKLYLNETLKNWRRKCCNLGVKIDDSMLYSLNYADDQVIFAEEEDDVLYMLRKLHEEYLYWGLEINFNKTEYLVVGGDAKTLCIPNGPELKSCQNVTYLGTQIAANGGSTQDIQSRISKGKVAIRQLHPLIRNQTLSKNVKRRLYKTIVESIATYGSEVWEISKGNENKLTAMEMDYWRRSCGLTLLDKVRNEEIRRKAEVSFNIIDTIEIKRLKWYGHLNRMGEERWPLKLWNWKPTSHRRRGRPRSTWKEGVEKAMARRGLTAEDCSDRLKWKLGCERRLMV